MGHLQRGGTSTLKKAKVTGGPPRMAPPRVVTEGGPWAEAPASRGNSVQAQGTKAQRQDRACHAGNTARAAWPDGSKAAPRKARPSAVPEPEPEVGVTSPWWETAADRPKQGMCIRRLAFRFARLSSTLCSSHCHSNQPRTETAFEPPRS